MNTTPKPVRKYTETKPQTREEVIDWLVKFEVANGLSLNPESDRNWIWLVFDLAPLHKKCDCKECSGRAEIREEIKAAGFRFCLAGHALPSGNTSKWAHNCGFPTRFKRRDKSGRKDNEPDRVDDQEKQQPQYAVSDDALLAMIR